MEKRFEALWDNFASEYIPVSKRDKIAPPERYTYCYTQNGCGIYVETFEKELAWRTERCDVAYTEEEINNQMAYSRAEFIARVRDKVFKSHQFGWDGIRLVSWQMPFDVFKSQIEKCGLQMEDLEKT